MREEFGSIPAFYGKCSRMRAIEFVIRILSVLMFSQRTASNQVINQSDVSESTSAVTETTSCKQNIFRNERQFNHHFLTLNMLLISASLWWFCHTFVWKYHVTQLPFQLPWYAELQMEFPSPPFQPNYISILQTVQHWTGLRSCISRTCTLLIKLLVYHLLKWK